MRGARFRSVAGGVVAAKGFSAAGVRCGIKQSGKADLGMLVSDRPCAAAGVFTTIAVPAAPVEWCRAVVARGRARAVAVNSGCANACTGKRGRIDAVVMAIACADELVIDHTEVCVASTGVIGRPLPLRKIVAGMKDAAERLSPAPDGGAAFAQAIMTTDTFEKTIAVQTVIAGRVVTVGGSTKGAGMISPNVATMLTFITTDAAISAAMLRRALRSAADKSFNCITVDGDMSTNDTVLVLANGAAGNARIARPGRGLDQFAAALEYVCTDLAKKIARDGEGATKFVEIRVTGASSDRDAKRIAAKIANSPLVKCAMNGCDPNWGRIVAAAGSAGARFDGEKAQLRINGRPAYTHGLPADTPVAELEAAMKPHDIVIGLALGLGRGAATMWTCDLSKAYVAINADYHT